MNTSGLSQIFQASLILIAAYLAGAAANAEPKFRFDVTPIVPDPPRVTFVPAAINNHGVVAGEADGWPFRYHDRVLESITFTYAGVPLSAGFPIDINDAGDVLVHLYYFYLVRGTEALVVGPPDGVFPMAHAVNNRGEVAGQWGTAAIWSNGVVQIIDPTVAYGSEATDINDAGVAVGVTYDSAAVATIFHDGQSIPIGTLPGFASSYAHAINNRGEVLCTAYTYNTPWENVPPRAFLFRAGSMIDIGTLPGAVAVHPKGLNNLGHVVGYVEDAQGQQRAFLYLDGVMHDLTEFIKPNSGWTFLKANAINDKDQIAGVGQINGGVHTAFLLTPKRHVSPAFDFKPPRGASPAREMRVSLAR